LSFKIFHSADIHIGMKFGGYPQNVREDLADERFKVLERMVKMANEKECQVFVIAGDLFDKKNIKRGEIERVKRVLKHFRGDCLLILPGNHDYDDGMVPLWDEFRGSSINKILLLNETRPYFLNEFGLDAAVFPAPCGEKHSATNNLGWIKELRRKPEGPKLNLGIAHGSLEGLSPDLTNDYFPMTFSELEETGMDLWLLGHTHISYPETRNATNQKIFNAGTPEPDGMDCRHEGGAWIISLDDSGVIEAERVNTGKFLFRDEERKVRGEDCFKKIIEEYNTTKARETILRLKVKGRIDRETFEKKENYYKALDRKHKYFILEDSELGIGITEEMIEEEFSSGSLPYLLIKRLIREEGLEEAQLAYEMIKEVREK